MQDPVCGMEVNEDDSAAQSLYNGRVYYFCSEECKRKFDGRPQYYVEKMEKAVEKTQSDVRGK